MEVKLMKIRFRFYLGSEELKFQLLHYTHKLCTASRNGTVIVVACQLETIYENHSSIIFIRFIRASREDRTVRERSVESKLYISRKWFSVLFYFFHFVCPSWDFNIIAFFCIEFGFKETTVEQKREPLDE